MELRQVEPLFVLLSLLALVACMSRLVPTAAQAPTPMPARTSLPAATPTVTPLSPSAIFPSPTWTPTQPPTATVPATPIASPTRSPTEPPIGPLAFIDRQKRLLLRDEDGAQCALTKEGAAASPAWSPDGARLAYSYQTGEGAAAELRVYHLADGTHETFWVDPGFLDPLVLPFREIAWAPSGQYVFLGQGCCIEGSIYVLDLETRSLAGQYTSYGRVLWSPGEDLLALSVPQPVETPIPIESGDSSSVALARPGQITPTLVLTGTVERMYRAHAWLSTGELLYEQADLYEGGNRVEPSWWSAEISVRADGTPTAAASHPLESLPLACDDARLKEYLAPWLPGADLWDRAWSPDGAWVVFRAHQKKTDRQIYAFHWDEGPLVGPLAEGTDLALAPARPAWRCPEG